MQDDQKTQVISGASQRGLRDHNERLLLSLIRQLGPIPASELARQVDLSAQTVSVIVRNLESDGLLKRGDPVRGKVGKPSTPMTLAADGAYAMGLKIGRRTADLAMMDLHGELRDLQVLRYPYPRLPEILEFLRDGLLDMTTSLPQSQRERFRGLGLAAPFEMWKWAEAIGAPPRQFQEWRDVDLAQEISTFCDLPIHMMNDATSACRAEHNFGAGRRYGDYAYFFVGSFIGGGVALDGTVLDGNRSNAGALGSLQVVDEDGQPVQLIDCASLHLLEAAIESAGVDPARLWEGDDWTPHAAQVDAWIARAAREIARAAISACAVLDFEAVIIDGAFPTDIRKRLVAEVGSALGGLDARGTLRPEIVEGQVGQNARVLGAAYAPISAEFFLSTRMRTANI